MIKHIFFLAILVLGFSMNSAFAADTVPVTKHYRYCSDTESSICNIYRLSPTIACINWAEHKTAVRDNPSCPGSFIFDNLNPAGNVCRVKFNRTSGTCENGWTEERLPAIIKSCPGGGVQVSDELCSVPPPPPPPVCTAGQKWIVVAPLGRWPKNHRGCAATLVEVLKCYKSPTGDYCKYEIMLTGAPAGPDEPDVVPPVGTPPPPEDGPRTPTPPLEPPAGEGCPKGTVQAGSTASGTPICVGTGTDPDNPKPPTTTTTPPVTTSDGNGGTVETATTITTNADGSSTTTTITTTIGADGTKTVSGNTSTTAATGGAPGVSDSQNEKGFCQQNPTLSICRNSSVSGTCGTIVCQGDAVQCATLRAAALMECRQKEDVDKQKDAASTALGDSILAGGDPMGSAIEANMAGTTVDLSNPNLDSSGFLGGGSCFPPMSFSVAGRPVSVSFAMVCENILPLRYAVMVLCSIVGYLIVARSVLGA